jgi:hypothetical protein
MGMAYNFSSRIDKITQKKTPYETPFQKNWLNGATTQPREYSVFANSL